METKIILTSKSISELIELVEQLIAEVSQLRSENQQLRAENQALRVENPCLKDELARIKKLPPRPNIGPSKLEKSIKNYDDKKQKNWSKKSKNQYLVIDEVVTIEVSEEQHRGSR